MRFVGVNIDSLETYWITFELLRLRWNARDELIAALCMTFDADKGGPPLVPHFDQGEFPAPCGEIWKRLGVYELEYKSIGQFQNKTKPEAQLVKEFLDLITEYPKRDIWFSLYDVERVEAGDYSLRSAALNNLKGGYLMYPPEKDSPTTHSGREKAPLVQLLNEAGVSASEFFTQPESPAAEIVSAFYATTSTPLPEEQKLGQPQKSPGEDRCPEIKIPHDLWKGRSPSVVRDNLRASGHTDSVIARVLYEWCGQNDTFIGRLLFTPKNSDPERGTSDSAHRRRGKKLRKEAAALTILAD